MSTYLELLFIKLRRCSLEGESKDLRGCKSGSVENIAPPLLKVHSQGKTNLIERLCPGPNRKQTTKIISFFLLFRISVDLPGSKRPKPCSCTLQAVSLFGVTLVESTSNNIPNSKTNISSDRHGVVHDSEGRLLTVISCNPFCCY
jgi:hypothetical protein